MFKQTKQYGTWPSPITPAMMAGRVRLFDVQWERDSDTIVWLESRGGKRYLVAQEGPDAPRDLTSGDMPVRGGVGYGGGAFTLADGTVYFAGAQGRLYRVGIYGGVPHPITPAFGSAASPRVSNDGRWIAYAHTYEGRDGLALVDVNGAMWPQKLIFGTDFVMQPAWHPDGKYLAYVAWHYPQMPWDGTELHLAILDYDRGDKPYIADLRVIAGNSETAIFQPEFSPDGRYLAYVSDATGYGQIYLYDLEQDTHTQLTDVPAEHGKPAWVQGMRMYDWSNDGKTLYFLRNTAGFYSLHHYQMDSGETKDNYVLNRYTGMEQITVSGSGERTKIGLVASSSTVPPRVISYRPAEDTLRVHRRSAMEHLYPSELSAAHPMEWKSEDGETVYGLYHKPNNGQYTGNGAPPLIVMVHGGPTSQRVAEYDRDAQFFATRGYAILQVNYRGSTGYGREYMLKMRERWGEIDVQDCASGAQHLVDEGLADPRRLVIMGSSAGGYTIWQSLIMKPGFYRAAISRYGVTNLFLLAQETHKFEARYTDMLVGPLPDETEKYRQMSPVFHAEQIKDPVLIFQGTEDVVVPKNQSDDIVKTLRSRGVPHEYHVYEGEGHGFRKPETLKHYFETIESFLQRYVIYA